MKINDFIILSPIMFIFRILIVIGIGNDTALLPQQYQTNIGVKRHKIGLERRRIEVRLV